MATAMSFTTQILKDLGASSGLIGGASIFYMAAAVSSARFASTALCARRGARFYIPLVFLLVTIYCILVPRVGNVAVIFLLQALPGMSNGILLSYLTSESMRDVPEEKKSTAMGLFQAVYAVGMSMFPAVVGALAEHINVAAGSPAVSGSGFADVRQMPTTRMPWLGPRTRELPPVPQRRRSLPPRPAPVPRSSHSCIGIGREACI